MIKGKHKQINAIMRDAAKDNAKETDQYEDGDALEAALIAEYIVASSPHSKHDDCAISPLAVLSECYDREDYVKLCCAKSPFRTAARDPFMSSPLDGDDDDNEDIVNTSPEIGLSAIVGLDGNYSFTGGGAGYSSPDSSPIKNKRSPFEIHEDSFSESGSESELFQSSVRILQPLSSQNAIV